MTGPTCFLLLTHKEPRQVARLVTRLAPYPVFVHVDARSSDVMGDAVARLAGEQDRVHLLPRYRSGWGSWGQVRAILEGLRRAAATECTHVVILTGQDYPLRPVREIHDFLASRPATSWVRHAEIPVSWLGPDGGRSRITGWHLAVKGRRVRVPLRRRVPEGIVPFYGQAQCCLSADLARWIVEEIRRRPELVRFFRRTWLPDELFLPSLAMASPMAPDVSDENIWFARWSPDAAHPWLLGCDDIEELRRAATTGGTQGGWGSVKLFARKFDLGHDAGVLDRIDDLLLEEPGPAGRPEEFSR